MHQETATKLAQKSTVTTAARVSNTTRLQKGILRLAFSYYGHNQDLDQQLDTVKSLLRSASHQGTDIQKHIDAIVSTILRLGTTLDNSHASAPSVNSTTLELLNKLSLPADGEPELAAIKQRLAEDLQQAELLEQINAAARLLNRIMADTSSQESFSQLREPILHLLENLQFPNSMHQQHLCIKRELETAHNTGELKTALDAFADLVNQSQLKLLSEVDEVGEYLNELVGQLSMLESSLGIQNKLQADCADDAAGLSQEFEAQVETMRNNMAKANSMTELKDVISSRLDSIGTIVLQHLDVEQLRGQQMKQEIDKMNKRLVEMESETEQLNRSLLNEQNRSYKDSLTGINNRLAYDERINTEYHLWLRNQTPLSLIIIDIDFFKKINDTYGHTAGDKVLCHISEMMHTQIRNSDCFARIGGEEFAVILPNTGRQDAHQLAEKLRSLVSASGFHYKEQPVTVTISCGVSQFSEGDSIEQAFERADKRLYQAKDQGRNRVCSNSDGMDAEAS